MELVLLSISILSNTTECPYYSLSVPQIPAHALILGPFNRILDLSIPSERCISQTLR